MSDTLNPIQQLNRLGQSVWYDNMYRALIDTGELQRLIDSGITGLTSNPTIFQKAISSSDDYDDSLIAHAAMGNGPADLFEALAIEDIQAAADLLRPVYDQTGSADGFASLEVNPHLAHDTEGTVEAAQRLFAALGRPNVMIKVPATPEGVPAIRRLIGQGININVTLIFSLEMYARVREAYLAGLEDLIGHGGDPSGVSSVASFFVSRVDTAVDGLIGGMDGALDSLLGEAAVANAKIAYQDFRYSFDSDRFRSMADRGARVQRPLWASTSTKNPDFSDVLYVETLIGRDTVNTMPDATLTAFLEHGTAIESIENEIEEARAAVSALEAGGISMEAVTTQLMHDGVTAFANSFDELIENIAAKRDRLLAVTAGPVGVSLGKVRATAHKAVASLEATNTVQRIWSGDHTLWSYDPTEITDRLGWLDVASSMLFEVDQLTEFAVGVRDEGIKHVVLLGMGGSSLGPEVLGQCLGRSEGWPELIVLDSTIPARVKRVAASIDPANTLFIVSSKSGTTIEPNMLYQFFRHLTEEAVGAVEAGSRFVAVTDAGTALDNLAQESGFRRVFRNPPEIGGRYSVLSYFGLVPAALIGFDIRGLLDSAIAMQELCGPSRAAFSNAGAWLGAVIGALANSGRDKLTILTSPSLDSFGLWVEQLVAESLGKSGRGVVPIIGEPIDCVSGSVDDRLFIYLKLAGEDSIKDTFADRLTANRQPVVRYQIEDIRGLGGEFYRWEFAIATAGAVMGVHPFDQPDVQTAKDLTEAALARFESDGSVPSLHREGSIQSLVSRMKSGDYLAILAYLEQTPDMDESLANLRSAIAVKYAIPTTLGYGPSYLHSTGQLHKGGAGNVAALMLTAPHAEDVEIPGANLTFGVLADAQASSDLEALRSAGRNTAAVVLDESSSTVEHLLSQHSD